MDAKALAKKRAHSQHHSKKYQSNQKAKAPADGGKANVAGNANKPLGKQIKEKTQPSQGPSGSPRIGIVMRKNLIWVQKIH
ncbi:hypothetical protein M0R45_031090 [Rubus argutus]|uniref:Uncharacterized protein n=1 Tax=Rubus argutus TaxID=59490 RepID=A0AAW1WHB3_RUBAR